MEDAELNSPDFHLTWKARALSASDRKEEVIGLGIRQKRIIRGRKKETLFSYFQQKGYARSGKFIFYSLGCCRLTCRFSGIVYGIRRLIIFFQIYFRTLSASCYFRYVLVYFNGINVNSENKKEIWLSKHFLTKRASLYKECMYLFVYSTAFPASRRNVAFRDNINAHI